MYQIIKRDGQIAEFDISKIANAMKKAFDATNTEYTDNVIDFLAIRVSADFLPKIKNGYVAVEDIQDSVESVLSRGGYDAVVCVHVIPAMMMTALKQAWSACPVFCFVATDYTCSPTVGACTPDICVIPHQELADEFVSCGIARDTLLPAGIPVRSAFREHGDRVAARKALGLPETGRHIVLMSGSIGCGPMGDVAEDLDMRMADGDFATVLCGSNKQMRYALELRRLYRVEAVGFTTQVQLYMDSADVLVSKPGGISITEAACKGVPMLLADLVGGCETRNQAFFSAHGWAASCDTDAIQYESDTVMRPAFGDDYAIACCVSAMRVGKDMQFFGARANLAKLVLLAINGGMDEVKKTRVAPEMPVWPDEYVDFDGLLNRLDFYRDWLAKTYVDAMNTIHYMHDKYAYEKSQMALHDTNVRRLMAFGIAGMSCMADSLSAIKYAKVRCIRDPETGLVTDFETEGEFPKYGNDDDRVDQIAHDVVHQFMEYIRMNDTYRNSVPTTSVLTITSNVVYGKKTGSTPDGRKAGQPFAPGANPMHKRDSHGAIASLSSVSKLPFRDAQDGISNTFSIIPSALGKEDQVFFGDIDLDQLGE